MGQKFSRFLTTIVGVLIGYYLGYLYVGVADIVHEGLRYQNILGIILAFGMTGYLLGPTMHKELVSFNAWMEGALRNFSPRSVISGAIGLLGGLFFANLITMPVLLVLIDPNRREVFLPLVFFVNSTLAFLGLFLGVKVNTAAEIKRHHGLFGAALKILDTSVLIDGRILDIYRTGFVEGELLIPSFVFQELRHIADSYEPLRRNRGRRGLDVVHKMQEELGDRLRVLDFESGKGDEVDELLIRVAKKHGGTIVTNDFNLNKQASAQRVKVLNINELANSVKSIVLPGEEMEVHLIKEGKEPDQGVAYLEDGTMVVVEEGRRSVGETVDVYVTNILQTPSGRVVFARPKTFRRV